MVDQPRLWARSLVPDRAAIGGACRLIVAIPAHPARVAQITRIVPL